MEAFEKWRNGQKIEYLSGRSHKADARVWRAALEWLLTQSLCGYSSDIVRKELDGK